MSYKLQVTSQFTNYKLQLGTAYLGVEKLKAKTDKYQQSKELRSARYIYRNISQ